MRQIESEQFKYTGEDIIELKNDYEADSVRVFYIQNSINKDIEIIELGENYIQLELGEPLETNTTINITYNVKTVVDYSDPSVKLQVLEKEVKELKKAVRILEEALGNRVTNQTFNMYLKNLEKKLGVSVIDQSYFQGYP